MSTSPKPIRPGAEIKDKQDLRYGGVSLTQESIVNKTTAAHTKYPRIFENVYWGCFKVNEISAKDFLPDIIDNRNAFVEKLGIVRQKSYAGFDDVCYCSPYRDINNQKLADKNGEMDHPEMYVTRNKMIVMICSNYNCPPPEVVEMLQCPDLYSHSAKTYIRVFDSLKAWQQFAKAFKPKIRRW